MLTKSLLTLTTLGAEWVLWLLIAISFISIAVIIERVIYYSVHKIDAAKFALDLQERLRSDNKQEVLTFLDGLPDDVIEFGIVRAGVKTLSKGMDSCAQVMQCVRARMRTKLDTNLSLLATIGANSPFVGLLGTVLGIIHAAHQMSSSESMGNPNAVMAGVFEALVATAVGLFVAIPAVVAYNLFQRRVRLTLAQVDSLMHFVLAMAKSDSRRFKEAPTNNEPSRVGV